MDSAPAMQFGPLPLFLWIFATAVSTVVGKPIVQSCCKYNPAGGFLSNLFRFFVGCNACMWPSSLVAETSPPSVTAPPGYQFQFTNLTRAAPEETFLFIFYHETSVGASESQSFTEILKKCAIDCDHYPGCIAVNSYKDGRALGRGYRANTVFCGLSSVVLRPNDTRGEPHFTESYGYSKQVATESFGLSSVAWA
ncbi:hypothetical protein C8R45DRAFT_123213 [Mycena sanguinolenta]|nr:hypothetical protein C8R45DRAFT_123213 [Mycena sanguinolenta]